LDGFRTPGGVGLLMPNQSFLLDKVNRLLGIGQQFVCYGDFRRAGGKTTKMA
jgi:hypothetical protein